MSSNDEKVSESLDSRACEFSIDNVVDEMLNECECGFETESSVFPDNYVLAQSYVPIQKMNKIFNSEVGLKMGTIFPELVSSYCPNQSIEEIEKIKSLNNLGKGCK